MRILWLNANVLLPLDKGGKLRTWHLLRHLMPRHEITYLAFADPADEASNHAGMVDVCSRLITIPRRDSPKQSLRFYARVAARLLDPLPYAIGKYRSRAYRRALAALLATENFDLIVCDFLVPAVNLPTRLPCPAVLFTHNVEAEIWRRHAETSTDWLRRRLCAVQWARMRRFEGRTLARFAHVLTVSDVDRQALQRLYPRQLSAPVSVVSTGVDTGYFASAPRDTVRPRHLVFTGSMDWLPNEDGILFFYREILPHIRRAEPNVTVSIVGRSPTDAIRRLAHDPAIEITGRVDDVRPYLASAAVYIVPLRIGGGTRLKIFEAMAMAKAVVSTTIGAEGLPVISGHHLLLADAPRSFAQAVVGLLHDEEARRSLEDAARDLVVTRYDWTVSAGELEDALIETAAGRVAPPVRALPLPPVGAVNSRVFRT